MCVLKPFLLQVSPAALVFLVQGALAVWSSPAPSPPLLLAALGRHEAPGGVTELAAKWGGAVDGRSAGPGAVQHAPSPASPGREAWEPSPSP